MQAAPQHKAVEGQQREQARGGVHQPGGGAQAEADEPSALPCGALGGQRGRVRQSVHGLAHAQPFGQQLHVVHNLALH